MTNINNPFNLNHAFYKIEGLCYTRINDQTEKELNKIIYIKTFMPVHEVKMNLAFLLVDAMLKTLHPYV